MSTTPEPILPPLLRTLAGILVWVLVLGAMLRLLGGVGISLPAWVGFLVGAALVALGRVAARSALAPAWRGRHCAGCATSPESL